MLWGCFLDLIILRLDLNLQEKQTPINRKFNRHKLQFCWYSADALEKYQMCHIERVIWIVPICPPAYTELGPSQEQAFLFDLQ